MSKQQTDRPNRIRNAYGKFAQIPEVLVRDASVSDRAIRIYALLWTYSTEKNRRVWPTRSTMAKVLNVSTKTIDRGLTELEERGAITIEPDYDGDRQTSNIYTIQVLANTAPKAPEVIHRGDKYVAPPLSTGATNMTPPGATNMSHQEEEPQEEEIYSPVPDVTTDALAAAERDRTKHDSPQQPAHVPSPTLGKPLNPVDVFTAVGEHLPATFTDGMLEQLAAEITGRAATRVMDPTGYVIRVLRGRDYDPADRGKWLARADEIATIAAEARRF